jgi:DNA-binding response OmpR family regulator
MSSTQRKKVLICDDNAHLAMIIKHLLTKRGFSVTTAEDGNEGLSLVRSTQPDLLLLDLHMAERDGISVLEALKAAANRPYTIVVSAQQGREKREQATTLGANEIWKKPFNASELLSRIEALVEQGVI